MKSALVQSLVADVDKGADVKSSHWQEHTKSFDVSDSNLGIDGFGQNSGRSLKTVVWHTVWHRILNFGSPIFQSRQYLTMRELCRRQNRALSEDSLRHVFTHHFIDERIPDARTICVIGDGRSHFVGPRLIEGKQKIVSINLREVLASDVSMLETAGLASAENTRICASRADVLAALDDPAISLVLVPAEKADAVENAGIDLFVNIASFQEMTQDIVATYFDLIRSNRPAYFYCCNREEKVLYGGECLKFDEYPWGACEKLAWEDCPWHQRYYSAKPPFVHRYDGKHKHALVRYT